MKNVLHFSALRDQSLPLYIRANTADIPSQPRATIWGHGEIWGIWLLLGDNNYRQQDVENSCENFCIFQKSECQWPFWAKWHRQKQVKFGRSHRRDNKLLDPESGKLGWAVSQCPWWMCWGRADVGINRTTMRLAAISVACRFLCALADARITTRYRSVPDNPAANPPHLMIRLGCGRGGEMRGWSFSVLVIGGWWWQLTSCRSHDNSSRIRQTMTNDQMRWRAVCLNDWLILTRNHQCTP